VNSLPDSLLIGRDHPERAATEQFIRSRYAEIYGARIETFPERLAGWRDRHGVLRAACGFRTAADGFFSETYLDAPAEMAISRAFRRPIDRARILEVTTLSASQTHGALALLHGVIVEARHRGIDFGLFTGTARLRGILGARGISPRDIGPARPDRLTDAARWGRYYDNDPRVCALHDAREEPLTPFRPSPTPVDGAHRAATGGAAIGG
jgi:hypothetical protein